MNQKELINIINLSREIGLNKVEYEGITFHIPPKIEEKKEYVERSAEEIIKPLSEMEDFSEEDILYYSVPFYEELQDKKARLTKKDI